MIVSSCFHARLYFILIITYVFYVIKLQIAFTFKYINATRQQERVKYEKNKRKMSLYIPVSSFKIF